MGRGGKDWEFGTKRKKEIALHCVYSFFFFLNKFIYLYIFGCVGSLLLCTAFSSCGEGGYSSLRCVGFSLQWLLLLRSTGSRYAGLVAPRPVRSSRKRARARVPCIGRRILNHCATREVRVYSSVASFCHLIIAFRIVPHS